MADWQLIEASRIEIIPDGTNPFTGVVVTGSATTQVMGSYVTLGHAPFDCCGIQITTRNHTSATDYLGDVAIGAAGSEVVVIENMYLTGPTSSNRTKNFFYPLRVKSGTRISARIQNFTGSSTIAFLLGFFGESFLGSPAVASIHTYGAIRASSSATALGAPGANAWGAWTEITPNTVRDHTWIMPVYGDADLATRTAQSFAFQTAVGSAGNERPVCPPFMFHASSTALQMTTFPSYWMNVKQGERLSCRYSAVAATNLGLEVVIYAGMTI